MALGKPKPGLVCSLVEKHWGSEGGEWLSVCGWMGVCAARRCLRTRWPRASARKSSSSTSRRSARWYGVPSNNHHPSIPTIPYEPFACVPWLRHVALCLPRPQNADQNLRFVFREAKITDALLCVPDTRTSYKLTPDLLRLPHSGCPCTNLGA